MNDELDALERGLDRAGVGGVARDERRAGAPHALRCGRVDLQARDFGARRAEPGAHGSADEAAGAGDRTSASLEVQGSQGISGPVNNLPL